MRCNPVAMPLHGLRLPRIACIGGGMTVLNLSELEDRVRVIQILLFGQPSCQMKRVVEFQSALRLLKLRPKVRVICVK